MERKPVETLLKEVQEIFESSSKTHLLFTGSINVGKTTLLSYILKDTKDYTYVKTYLSEDFSEVLLTDSLTKEEYIIGKRCKDFMKINENFFDKVGYKILENHLNTPNNVFVIDEIGKLEIDAKKYISSLEKLFNNKKVIACIRKDKNAIYGNNNFLENSCLIDLDELNRFKRD